MLTSTGLHSSQDASDTVVDRTWIKNPKCPRSRCWIVYENGRACAPPPAPLSAQPSQLLICCHLHTDPRYVVRYYRGRRDPARTLYESPADLPDGRALELWEREDTEAALLDASSRAPLPKTSAAQMSMC